MATTNTRSNTNTSVRLPRRIDRLWSDTAHKMGINRTAVLVTALRDLAKREGVAEREDEEEEETA
jgi:hypothetical protein